MSRKIIILTIVLFVSKFCFAVPESTNNVYIIFYATCKGKTGHMGIAVDNYKVIFKGSATSGLTGLVADTVTTGELTYYDLWPDEDHFSAGRTGKDIPGVYYKLPLSSLDAITINSLYDKGIPHKENYPCDGLLSIATSRAQDDWMVLLLDSMVNAKKQFNGRRFNCSDFVRIPVEKLLHKKIKSNEFVLLGWSTTPNKLYRNLRKEDNVTVIKSGDKKAAGSFIGQRVIFKLFHHPKK